MMAFKFFYGANAHSSIYRLSVEPLSLCLSIRLVPLGREQGSWNGFAVSLITGKTSCIGTKWSMLFRRPTWKQLPLKIAPLPCLKAQKSSLGRTSPTREQIEGCALCLSIGKTEVLWRTLTSLRWEQPRFIVRVFLSSKIKLSHCETHWVKEKQISGTLLSLMGSRLIKGREEFCFDTGKRSNETVGT